MTTTVSAPAYLHKIHAAWPAVEARRVHLRSGPFVLLVSGSREAEYDVWEPVIEDVLRMVAVRARSRPSWSEHPPLLRHGAARGVDTWASGLARRFHLTPDPYPVTPEEWAVDRKGAGHGRNRRMVDAGADLTVAFIAHSRSNGTRGCAAYSKGKGIPTVRITYEDLLLPWRPL